MVKAVCIWCNTDKDGNFDEPRPATHGMFYFHFGCFHELIETADDIKYIKQILNGEKEDEDVISFIKRMERFQRRTAGTAAICAHFGASEQITGLAGKDD